MILYSYVNGKTCVGKILIIDENTLRLYYLRQVDVSECLGFET